MRSGESSIEQWPDTRICVVQRISNGMKECEGDGCQRKSEAVEKECITLCLRACSLYKLHVLVMNSCDANTRHDLKIHTSCVYD